MPPDEEPEGLADLRDPYEAAARRMDERRAAEAAGDGGSGGSRSGSEGDAAGDGDRRAPDLLAARTRRRVLPKFLIGLGAILLLMRLGAARQPKPPDLATDCTTPAFALSAESVKQARAVTFTIVGPDTKRYVLGVNTMAFVPSPRGGYHAVPLRGREEDMLLPTVKPMKGCRATGLFALPVEVGEHQVKLYELTPAGTIEVERKTIEVTAPTP